MTTLLTVFSLHRNSAVHRSLSDLPTTHHSIHHPSLTRTYQVVPSHPRATVGPQESAPLVPAAYHLAPALPVGNGTDPKALTHPSMLNYFVNLQYSGYLGIEECVLISPRRACAARVTVVGLSVCLFVCLSTTILALQATRRLMSDTNSFSATRA